MRRSLPVLDNGRDSLDLVEIRIPCQVPWESMPGDAQVRHCGQCKQNVYNLSSYTRPEAMRLLRARACLRIYRRPDNTVITSDCRARLRAARKRGLLVFAGALVVVLWAQICAQFVGLLGLRRVIGGSGRTPTTAPAPIHVRGQVAAPPTVPLGPAAPSIEMGDVIGPLQGDSGAAPPPRAKRHTAKPRKTPGVPVPADFVIKGLEEKLK